MYRKLLTLFCFLLILSLILVACGGDEEEPTEEPAPSEEEAMPEEEEEPMEMVEVDWAVAPGGYMEKALAGEYAGTTVTFDGPFADIDAVLF